MRSSRIDITPSAYLYWACLLLLFPLRWLFASFVAAAVHEICHILAVRWCRGEVWSLRIHPGGAEIETSPLAPEQELVCALAGPLGALVLLPFFRWIPCTVVCAILQSIYNLLPVFPLDGGRALGCGLILLVGEKRGRIIQTNTEKILMILLLAAGIFAFLRLNSGILPLVAGLYLASKGIFRKIPCKSAA